MRGLLSLVIVLVAGCGGGGPPPVVHHPDDEPRAPVTPAAEARPPAQDVAGSTASSPVAVAGRVIATSTDKAVELRETSPGAYAIHDAQGDRPIPAGWMTDSEGPPSLSPDGALLGVQRVASTGTPEFAIHRLSTMTPFAVRSPATRVAGGKIAASFGSVPGSIVWTFSRANCELQDVASGKPKCGSCDNSVHAAFDPADERVARVRASTTDCVK